jgi:hypothetical protein
MWMNCPASVTKAEGRVRPSSKYAREGTAAHRIAEGIINGDPFPPERLMVEGEEFVIGRDMLRHLNGYIGFVEGLREWGRVWIETRVGLTYARSLVWGTADCLALTGTRLTIADLKYGKGVPVPADSAQLKIYALGGMDVLQTFPDTIELVVFQPRLDPIPKIHTMTFAEIIDWGASELRPAIARLEIGDQTEHAGPWCRWCVRRDECAAYATRKSGSASDIFDDGVDLITV